MSLILPAPLGFALASQGLPFYGTDPTVFHIDFKAGRVWDGANQVELTLEDVLSNAGVVGSKWYPQANGLDALKVDTELPVTDLGLHCWKAATNLAPTPEVPTTFSLSLAAGTYCMQMRGPGSYAITGSFSVAPAGAVVDGTFRTFTLSSTQTITFTLTGTATAVQVETGNFPTPFVHVQGVARPIENMRAIGALLAALQMATTNEGTVRVKHITPASQPASNRRLIRGSNGSAHIFTFGLTSLDKYNISHTANSASAFNFTSTASVLAAGTVNEAYAKIKANDFKMSMPLVVPPELQTDNAGAVTMSQITDFAVGRRNDNTNEPLNGVIEQITIWPRGLEDAEFIPFDPRPVPEIPFVDYPAIAASGGQGGTVYNITAFDGSLRTRLTQSGPRIVKIDPALTGVEPTTTTALVISHGALTFRGHKNVIVAKGGNYQVGTSGTPVDVVIEDVHFCPGDGATGQVPDNRDGLGVHQIDTPVLRNCVLCYAIDEAIGASVYSQTIKRVLIENCVIGPNLKQVRDANGNLYKPAEPNHNYGLLMTKRAANVVVRNCLFVCCRQRSPDFYMIKGGLFQNNIVYNVSNIATAFWGNANALTDFVGMTGAARNNLYKAGPNSPDNWLDRCQVLGYLDRGSAVYFSDNFGTDGSNFSGDTAIAPDRVLLRNGSSKGSLVPSMPFGTPYAALPTATAQNRQDLWNYVLDRVGVRSRDGGDAIITGDAAASPLTAAIIAAMKAGTLAEIVTPGDFVGYLT